MKTISKKTAIVFLSIGILSIIQSCKKELSPPDLFTLQISEVTQTSAVSRSVVNDDGGAEVTTRGVCWSTSRNPTTSSDKTVDRGSTGLYLSVISDLTANTTYYVRAYAVNSEGTNYGNELTFTTSAPISGIQKSDIPGVARYGSTCFSIGQKIYLALGFGDDIDSQRDFWEWDQVNDIWTKKADYPGNSYSGAVGFSIGTKGYLGTGFSINGSVTNEFWEYDPVKNTWTEKASLPVSAARTEAVGFSVGNKGYIGTGNFTAGIGGTALRDFWEWDQVTNLWTRKADFAGLRRSGAVGFTIGNKGYIGTGVTLDENGFSNYSSDFWEWDQETNKWTRKADLEGNPRVNAVGASIGEKGYIGSGINNDFEWGIIINDFWEYDPDL